MRPIILFITLISTILFYSCEPAATFDKPQPDNVSQLTIFPERLQGKYLSMDQASVLTISDKLITRLYDFDFKEHKDSLGSSYIISGDTLINVDDGTKEKISLKGDTVFQHINGTDTLFAISTDNILKKFKGYYFLSTRYSDNAWEVKKISLQNGRLTIGSFSNDYDVQKLKEIKETDIDTIPIPLTFTRKQFKKFVKEGGFTDEETFTLMGKNGR